MIMPTNLKKQFLQFEKLCEGDLGISACHIETNQLIEFNAQNRFLMCSTYKVAIAIFLLHKVELNQINLNDMYAIHESDFLPGVVSSLNQLNYEVPQSISLHSFLLLMLQESCNTSTAIILNKLGGPQALDSYLRDIEIDEIGMDFYSFDMFAKWDGIKQLPPHCTLAQYAELERAVPPEKLQAVREKLNANIEETGEGLATPNAMTRLLMKLFKNEILNKQYTELLLKIMHKCKRGPQRLMGLLPIPTPVAHKTGSLTGYNCDIGIITLPHHAGHIAISVFIKKSRQDLANNERVIAEVGRSLYDFFLFQAESG